MKILSFFERLIPALSDDKTSMPPKTLVAFCLYYTKGYKIVLLIMTILAALLAITEVVLFGFLGQLVDWLATKHPSTLLHDEGMKLMGMGVLLLIVIPSISFLHTVIVNQTLRSNYPMSVRWSAHRYLLKQSVSFYEEDFAGRIAAKVMQTSIAVRETVMKLLDVAVYIAVYFLAMIIMVARQDYRLAIPMLSWLIIYLLLQAYFVPKLRKASVEQANARSTMTGRMVDSYTNISTVKLFSHTDAETQSAKKEMKSFLVTAYRQMRLVTGISFTVQLLNSMLVFSVTALALSLWINGTITIGIIAVTISLALRLKSMSLWIMFEISALFENMGTVIDGMNTFSKPNTIQDKKNAPVLKITDAKIIYEQVDFYYVKEQEVINKFCLTINPGEKIGLIGRSGAGKSTLVNLLLRFYEVNHGKILIDDQNINDVCQESLRLQIAMVTQDTSLLHRSIRENILYGRSDASEEEMIAAAKRAQAHDFILGLTDSAGNIGYESQVGERGVKLSGGQRQRIAIARVLLKDAPILVLDEATSALDSEVEAAIQENLFELMKGKTVIAIAHRLSTIAAMDKLIVIDEGKIIEQGTHSYLIEKGGVYSQLWTHQTGGFLGIN